MTVCTLCPKEEADPEVLKTWHEGEYGTECPDHPVDVAVSDRDPTIFAEVVQELQDAVHVRLADVLRLVEASQRMAEEDGVTYAHTSLVALSEKLQRLDTVAVKR